MRGFIWCGSEELGLLGSKAYVKENKELLEKISFCFNFDMCGTALGANDIFITGNKELETFVDQYCKLTGYSAKTRACVHSSDSAPFCDHNIPALGLSRGTYCRDTYDPRFASDPKRKSNSEKRSVCRSDHRRRSQCCCSPSEKGNARRAQKRTGQIFPSGKERR